MRISVRTGVSASALTHLRTHTWRMYACSKGWKLHAMLPMCSSLDSIRLARINAMPENYHVNPKPRKSKARRTRTACIAYAQNRFSLCAYLIYTLENALTAANRELSVSIRYADEWQWRTCKGLRITYATDTEYRGLHWDASLSENSMMNLHIHAENSQRDRYEFLSTDSIYETMIFCKRPSWRIYYPPSNLR